MKMLHSGIQLAICVFMINHIATKLCTAEPSSLPATLEQYEQQLIQIGKASSRSVVMLAALHKTSQELPAADRLGRVLHPEASQLPAQVGMGVVIDSNDDQLLILTTNHFTQPIIRNLKSTPFEILVKFSTNHVAEATILSSDPRSELAVLKVKLTPELQSIPAASSKISTKEAVTGSILIALGNPWEMAKDGRSSLAATIITNTNHSLQNESESALTERSLHELGTMLVLDLPVRFAMPGTPLFNLNGEFTGLLHSRSLFTQSDKTVSFAIPYSVEFQRVVRELKQGYEVEYGFLGISTETLSGDAFEEIPLSASRNSAASVLRVPQNSPAEAAGLQRDDLILEVNDHKIESNADLIREISLLKPNTSADLIVFRPGEGMQSLTVTLGKWPVYDDSLLVKSRDRFSPWKGLTVDYPTARRRFLRDRFLSVFPQGLVALTVTEGSIAEQAGLQVGQFIVKVDGQPVTTPQEFQKAVAGQAEVKLLLANGRELLISEDTE